MTEQKPKRIVYPDYHEYRERYCAFVDVLGFSELISKIGTSRTARDRDANWRIVHKLLHTVYTSPRYHDDPYNLPELRATSISDAVAISAAIDPHALLTLLDTLERFSLDLLKEGYFVHGALVRGDLYHDDQMVFGEALIRAYRLESQVARYPRIVIERRIIDDITEYSKDPTKVIFSGRVTQATDGPWYLHVLRQMGIIVNGTARLTSDRHFDPALYIGIQNWLQARLDSAADDPHRFEKVQWFAAYWNRTQCDNPDGIKCIFGPAVAYRL